MQITKNKKLSGVILTRKSSREADRLISIYTRSDGRVQFLARGVSKISSKRLAATEPLSQVELELTTKNSFYYLREAVAINVFKKIRTNYPLLDTANRLCELVYYGTTNNDPQPEIFDLMLLALETLNKNVFGEKNILAVFMIKFFSVSGHALNLKLCSSCNARFTVETISYSYNDCDFICNKCCAKNNCSDVDVFKFMRYCQEKPFLQTMGVRMPTESWVELEKLLASLYAEVFGHQLSFAH